MTRNFKALTDMRLNLPLLYKGKVRNSYGIPGNKNQMLVVTFDRISAGDDVLNSSTPATGIIINKLSGFWFKMLDDIIGTHLISCSTKECLYGVDLTPQQYHYLRGRVMLVQRLDIIPVECIVSWFAYGSLWDTYQKAQKKQTGKEVLVLGHWLPKNLKQAEKLPHPIFRPSTKAPQGQHDVNLDPAGFRRHLENWQKERPATSKKFDPANLAEFLGSVSLKLSEAAFRYADSRGLILPDCKMEFGVDPATGKIYWADEGFTPHSARWWLKTEYIPGKKQNGYDKDPIRDYVKETGSGELPKALIKTTQDKWLFVYRSLTGLSFDDAIKD